MKLDFIAYSVLGASLWGIMGIAESVCGQFNMPGALFTKYIMYSLPGVAFLLWKKQQVTNGLVQLATKQTTAYILLIMGIFVGCLGTFCVYKAFETCGLNKGRVLVISYCVPVIIMVTLSYFLLGEKYNTYALLGIIMIVAGVLIIKLKGSVDVKNHST